MMPTPITVVCECGDTFACTPRGNNRRKLCDECRVLRKVASKKRTHDDLRLGPGEKKANFVGGLNGISIMSQEEAAWHLAFWEALEAVLRNGAPLESLENIRPLSVQRVQQLERQALVKLRRAMKKEWSAYQEEVAHRRLTGE